jgi:hypothetical protein
MGKAYGYLFLSVNRVGHGSGLRYGPGHPPSLYAEALHKATYFMSYIRSADVNHESIG